MTAKPHQPRRLHIVIVSPALADANNGNWQTAQRWQQMLATRFHCRIVASWPDKFANQDDVMLALHAKKSAESIAAWHAQYGSAKLAVVLTGTDVYRDIQTDAAARGSLAMASRLIVLQNRAVLALPAEHQSKTTVIFQSTTAHPTTEKTGQKTTQHLRAVMVGHLRDEKSPETLFEAVRLLASSDAGKRSPKPVGAAVGELALSTDVSADIYIDHIGAPLDAALGRAATATALACPNYRWRGAMPHVATRRAIARAQVMVLTSKMEGGAHVIMEAACSGTPVLASRIDGNVGMLGEDYAGYFELGDAHQLAALLLECRRTQNEPNGLLAKLAVQLALRVPLFAPELEAEKLNALVAMLTGGTINEASSKVN
jgi:glycosyltransferase involved in cell wall biosynthesis